MLLVYLDLVFFAELHQRFPGVQFPIPPGCNNLDIRLQPINTQLKANLVIALAGRPMRYCLGSGLIGHLDQSFGNERSRDAGA